MSAPTCVECKRLVLNENWLESEEWQVSHLCITCLFGPPPGRCDRCPPGYPCVTNAATHTSVTSPGITPGGER